MIDPTGAIPISARLIGLTGENLTFDRHLLGSDSALLFYGRYSRKQLNTYAVMTSKPLVIP